MISKLAWDVLEIHEITDSDTVGKKGDEFSSWVGSGGHGRVIGGDCLGENTSLSNLGVPT